MTNTGNSVASRVRELCEEQKFTHSGLSKKAGLGKGAVADLLADPTRTPRPATIVKLAIALGVEVEYLLGETNQKSSLEPQENRGLGDPRGGCITQKVNKILQSSINSPGGKVNHVYLENGATGLGIPPGATVVLSTNTEPKTGDLVVVFHGGVHVCYMVEPYLVSLGDFGKPTHFLRDEKTEVLGVIQLVAKGYPVAKTGQEPE